MIHSVILLFTQTFIHSLAHPATLSFTDSSIQSFIRSLIYPLGHLLTNSSTQLSHLLVHSSVRPLSHTPFTGLSTHAFNHSFICSFVYLLTPSVIFLLVPPLIQWCPPHSSPIHSPTQLLTHLFTDSSLIHSMIYPLTGHSYPFTGSSLIHPNTASVIHPLVPALTHSLCPSSSGTLEAWSEGP